MGEPKMYASLSSGLLARKGAAKPAMRPQGFGHFGGGNLEDLGWNDMGGGEPAPSHVPSPITALTPSARTPENAPPPPVVEQQRQIAESFAMEVEAEAQVDLDSGCNAPVTEAETPQIAAPAPAPKPRKARRAQAVVPAGRKAAFTLRLDNDRHVRLRLASAVTRQSAQQIVTAALDAWLDTLPELDRMAAQLPAAKRN